jgi:dihydroorotase
MSNILLISNGRVIDPKNKRDAKGDICVIDGKIVNSLSSDQKKIARKIDATGLVVCPGLVDIQVHLREPGQTHKESIKTGSWAAAAGGITSMVCMGNTSPPCDNAGTIQLLVNVIQRDAVVNVFPTGCVTVGMDGKQLTATGSLKRAGVVALTDDGKCVQHNELMRRAVEYAKMHDLILLDHCQDYSLTNDSVMNEGEWSLRLGLKGWPNAAEDIIVSRNVIISHYTGAHVHLQHISSAGAVDIIRRAKHRGVKVTAEAMPHHMALTDACLKDYDTNFKMNPPLRTEHDRLALIEGLLDGTIDCIATDHAPHSPTEKDVEFDKAPFGVIGLETSLAVCLDVLVHSGKTDLPFLISRMTHIPSEILRLGKGTLSEGVDADITIFDPEEKWTVTDKFFSRSKNSPWIGCEFKGRVKKTIVAGNLVYDGKNVLA